MRGERPRIDTANSGNLPRFMETQAELWLEIAWAAAKFLNGFYDRNGEVATPQLELVTSVTSKHPMKTLVLHHAIATDS